MRARESISAIAVILVGGSEILLYSKVSLPHEA